MADAEQSVRFRYVWSLRVSRRQLSDLEETILHISPKFATVFGRIGFQWSLKLHESQNLEKEEDGEYLAVSLYFVDGPSVSVPLKAFIQFCGSNYESSDGILSHLLSTILENDLIAEKGKEMEISTAKGPNLSTFLNNPKPQSVRIIIELQMDSKVFQINEYLNAVSPTPFQSFLTQNYRARISSNTWKNNRPRSKSEGENRLERIFTHLVESENWNIKMEKNQINKKSEHPFKRLLINCCESCERRASIIPCSQPKEEHKEEEEEEEEEEKAFECPEDDKAEIHDILANMYFNKLALPQMEFVEDFTNFLLDAEMNELPVLKRACERYLCGELDTKKEIEISLVLDLFFLSMLFNLPVMKSMTLCEISDRFSQLENFHNTDEEYRKLDERIRSVSGKNLKALIDECRRFQEQRLRVQQIPTMAAVHYAD